MATPIRGLTRSLTTGVAPRMTRTMTMMPEAAAAAQISSQMLPASDRSRLDVRRSTAHLPKRGNTSMPEAYEQCYGNWSGQVKNGAPFAAVAAA